MNTYHETVAGTMAGRRMRAPQWLAVGAGAAAVAATVAILVGDALAKGVWTMEQTLGLVVLGATIAFGLLGRHTWGSGHRLASLAFSALFCLGTLLLVYSSMGSRAGSRAEAVAAATNANGALAALQAERNKLDEQLSTLQADISRLSGVRGTLEIKGALDAVVGNGAGKVPATIWRRTNSCAADQITKAESAEACRPALDLRIENGKALEREQLQTQFTTKEAERRGVLAKIEAAGGMKVVPGKAKGFAEVAGLFGFNAKHVETVMSKLDILLVTLFLELSAIVALEYGLAGVFAPVTLEAPLTARPAPEKPVPVPPKGTGRRGRKLDPRVVDFASKFEERHGRSPGGSELMAAFPKLPKSTAYDYAKRVA